jgi:hypothetical protein
VAYCIRVIRVPRKTPKRSDRSDSAHQDSVRIESVESPPGDVALVVGKDADGLHILRRRSQEAPLEAGLLRPLREGKPIVGELISLTQRHDLPMIFDVKSELAASAGTPERPSVERLPVEGPAQVASEAYRKGWDAVWGRRRDRSVN